MRTSWSQELGISSSAHSIPKLRVKQWYERILFPLELRLRDAAMSVGASWPIRLHHPLHDALLARRLFTTLRGLVPALFLVSPAKASLVLRCVCGHRHEYPPRTQCVVCDVERGKQVQ